MFTFWASIFFYWKSAKSVSVGGPRTRSAEGIRGSVTGQFPDGSRIHTGSGLAWLIFQITPDKPPYHSCWFCPQSKIKLKHLKSICPTHRQLYSSMFILTCLLLLKSWKKFCFFLPSVWNGHYHWSGVSVSVKTEIRLKMKSDLSSKSY